MAVIKGGDPEVRNKEKCKGRPSLRSCLIFLLLRCSDILKVKLIGNAQLEGIIGIEIGRLYNYFLQIFKIKKI